MDKLDFSDKKYLEILKSLEGKNGFGDKSELSSAEAFFYLIKGLPKEDLDNLSEQLVKYFNKKYIFEDLTSDEAYDMLQGKEVRGICPDEKLKAKILDEAYKLMDSGKTLGNKTIMDGKINTSSWINHCLYVARFSEVIAKDLKEKQGIDINTDNIKALAILHDYGRKFDHGLGHITKGAEALIDDGYPHAAVATVMHSFFAGSRCANNDRAVPGFYMDENGKECWEENAQADDVREYLDAHKFSIGDLILNLGDLVATSDGVVKLSERLADIATRRELDPTNRKFFLLKVIGGMTYILDKMEVEIPKEVKDKLPQISDPVEKVEESIEDLSDVLYTHYDKSYKKYIPTFPESGREE